jgi:hypothetical protein
MSHRPDDSHYVRRVVLPSGKTIEVVYFEEHPEVALRQAAPTRPDLHVCGGCGSRLVYPVEWQEAGPAHWEVTLRCPECEHRADGIYDQATVERFDEELDRGTDAVVRDLKRLTHANMQDDIERFVRALAQDLIVPDDF